MRGRDLAIVAAVLAVGAFAAADALRGDGSPAHRRPSPTTGRTATARAETSPVRTLAGVRPGLLGGTLVYTEAAKGCAVRELDLASGTLLPLAPILTTCTLVSAPRSERVAYSLRSPRRDSGPYEMVDLLDAARELTGLRARNGSLVWSPDGQRLAWCEPAGRGRELVVGRGTRTLTGCPVAYTPRGRAVYAEGRRLSAAGRTVVRAPGPIAAASFGTDASLAVLGEDGHVLLYGAGRDGRLARNETRLPPVLRGRATLFSPTNCDAAVLLGDRAAPVVSVVRLRACPGSRSPASFPGRAAAWSPDGRRLAVATDRAVTVYPIAAAGPAVRLPIAAVDLAWKP